MPIGSGYSPHACSPSGLEYLPITFHDVPASASFDTEFDVVIELRYPEKVDYSMLISGRRFELVEGSKRVGYAMLIAPVA